MARCFYPKSWKLETNAKCKMCKSQCLDGSGLNCTNYSATLRSWASQADVTAGTLEFTAGLKYSIDGSSLPKTPKHRQRLDNYRLEVKHGMCLSSAILPNGPTKQQPSITTPTTGCQL